MAQHHSIADGVAAAQRAREGPRPRWHPLLAAIESPPATWLMVDERGCYGIIRLVRRGDEIGYRADTWSEFVEARTLIGYYRTLRAACAATHHHYLRAHGNPTLPER